MKNTETIIILTEESGNIVASFVYKKNTIKVIKEFLYSWLDCEKIKYPKKIKYGESFIVEAFDVVNKWQAYEFFLTESTLIKY